MNPFKSVIAGIAIFSTAITAFAEPSTDATIIRITGSTAFRAAAHSAIFALFDSPPKAGYVGSGLSGSSRSFFYGVSHGNPLIVTTSWAGSVGGVQVVAGNIAVPFLPDTLADSNSPDPALTAFAGPGATGGQSYNANLATNMKVPDVAMSDTAQSATPFKAPLLYDKKVGVVGFKWLTNRGVNVVTKTATITASNPPVLTLADVTGLSVGMTVSSANLPTTLRKIASIDSLTQVTLTGDASSVTAGSASVTFATVSPITNINSQVAQSLYKSTFPSKLSQFTGNSADSSILVYALGRDPDSGTRLTAFAETGIGVDATVTQWKPTVASGKISALVPYPEQTLNGIKYDVGNSGEASGGTLGGFCANTSEALNAYVIAYVGASDATTPVAQGAKELTYNGVAYSTAAIAEGLYTFWCYEHVLYPTTWNSAASGSLEKKKKDIADEYANLIEATYAPIKLSEMNCTRAADGAPVFHN